MYPAQSSKRKKSPYFSDFIEKALIEGRALVFSQPGIHLSDT